MRPALAAVAALLETRGIRAVVSDLDGVLRVFDPALWEELDAELGLGEGVAFSAILGSPFLQEVVRGRADHARWREDARQRLVRAGADAGTARTVVERWAATPARVDEEVRALLLTARAAGAAVIVLTNGTDRVLEEARQLGLDDVIGPDGAFLLSSHTVGAAKPEPAAYAAAHRLLEEIHGEEVAPEQVVFLDDSPRNVSAAREHGWQAFHHAG